MMIQATLLNLAAFALQVCVIATVAALLLRVLQIGSAGTRYVCWRIALAACLVMPLALQRPAALPADVAIADQFFDLSVGEPIGDAAPATSVVPSSSMLTSQSWPLIVGLVIAAGVVVRAAWLLVGLIRLGTLRRRGIAVDDPEYREIQSTLGTRATMRSVAGLTQPATFGVWRPVVLLPETLASQPVTVRRAVVTHELFHVQRRDWLWVLMEEVVRAALWFHPAILWLTSRIQLAREELVDELTVLATGNRKAYIEALLAFADAGRVRPAPAFARRRHLFTRIVRLSKESVMSSPRIVLSAAVAIAAVLGTAWYASQAFPIVSAATELPVVASTPDTPAPTRSADSRKDLIEAQNVAPIAAAQGPRSGGAPRPGPATAVAAPAGTKPITPENPIPRRLSSVSIPYPSQLRGSGLRGAVTLQVTLDASGSVSNVRRMGVEISSGNTSDSATRGLAVEAFFTAATDAVRQWRYQPPADPPIAFFVTATFQGDFDAVTSQSDVPGGFGRGGGPTTAIAPMDSQLREQLVLREGRLESLRKQREQAAAQFGGQDPRVLELNRQLEAMGRELERDRELYARDLQRAATELRTAAEQGRPTGISGPGQTSGTPVRVGGNITPPKRTKQVNPEYPEIAKSAKVQGVVIMEIVVDEQGRVAEARVLRSIPLLDQAALDAVRQWEFTPTMLNGSPVPIVMTVTVQFMLPPEAQ
jgi:TonB family protein